MVTKQQFCLHVEIHLINISTCIGGRAAFLKGILQYSLVVLDSQYLKYCAIVNSIRNRYSPVDASIIAIVGIVIAPKPLAPVCTLWYVFFWRLGGILDLFLPYFDSGANYIIS